MNKLGYFLACIVMMTGMAGQAQNDYKAFCRYDYYTDENPAEMVVIVPDGKEHLSIQVDLVCDYEFLNRYFPVPSKGLFTVPFDLEAIKMGNNEVTVSFYENEKWVSSVKVNVIKRPPQLNEVKIDRIAGGLVSYGLPFFPVGFYSYWPVDESLPEEEVVKGFNLMSPYWKIERKGNRDREKFMDRCAELGIRVNYNLCSVAGGGGVGSSRSEGRSDDENMALLKKEVELFKDHPALLSWYIADEPYGQGVAPEKLKPAYDLIKELDPYHPVSVVFMTPSKAHEYADCMDIVMTDPYPVPHGSIGETGRVVSTLMDEFRYEKPVWIVPQAFGGNEWWDREPTRQELRVMTWLPAVKGARGVQYFIRRGLNSFPKSVATWGEAGSCALEIRELLPFLMAGFPVNVSADNEHVNAQGWFFGGRLAIVAVNDTVAPLNIHFNTGYPDFEGKMKLPFENRELPIVEGDFTDMMDGLSTRVYILRIKQDVHAERAEARTQLITDPGFENNITPGIPAACYARPGGDPGATYFTETRFYLDGNRSICLNTPSQGEGMNLTFKRVKLDKNRSYTISIYGVTRLTSNNMREKWRLFRKNDWIERDEELTFRLGLGDKTDNFVLGKEWKEFSIENVPGRGEAESAELELVNRGTAWFDRLEVVPDVEIATSINREDRSIAVNAYTPLDHRKIVQWTGVDDRWHYQDTVKITRSTELHIQLMDTLAAGDRSEKGFYNTSFIIHEALGSNVAYNEAFSERYPGEREITLVNGQLASEDFTDGQWQGFLGRDMEVVLDLGKAVAVDTLQLRFLENQHVWIFLPDKVTITCSDDGWRWSTPEIVKLPGTRKESRVSVYEMSVPVVEKNARYVKVRAETSGVCPDWHKGAGGKSWIFTDEIIIDRK